MKTYGQFRVKRSKNANNFQNNKTSYNFISKTL